jgi:hypothetical protein
MLAFLSKTAAGYYPNALCFKDKSKVFVYNNWLNQNYWIPTIAINACNPKRYHGTCKTTKEIDEFLLRNNFYFVTQKISVNKGVYQGDHNPVFND